MDNNKVSAESKELKIPNSTTASPEINEKKVSKPDLTSSLNPTNKFRNLTLEQKKSPTPNTTCVALTENLKRLSNLLICPSNNIIGFHGPTGDGKTTVIKELAKNITTNVVHKRLLNTTILYTTAKKPITKLTLLNEEINSLLSDFKEQNKDKVIICIDDCHLIPIAELKQFIINWNTIIEKNPKYEFLKLLLIATTIESKDSENFKTELNNYVNLGLLTAMPYSLFYADKQPLEILAPRLQELENKYHITISDDMKTLGYLGSSSKNNYHHVLKNFETVFEIASNNKHAKIEKNDWLETFSTSIERTRRKNTTKLLKKIAYHEAGHVLLCLHSKYFVCTGTALLLDNEHPDNAITAYTLLVENSFKEAVLDRQLIALGGKLVEKYIFNMETIGVTGDLKKCRLDIQEYIRKTGCSDLIGENYSLFAYNNLSPKMQDALDDSSKDLIKKLTKKGKKIVLKHKKFIKLLGKKLYKQGFLSQKEIYEMWEEYLNK